MNGAKPGLRARLVQHVLLPLALTWALGTVVVLGIAQHYAGQAFDRSMLDDAYALATRVVVRDGKLAIALSDPEMRTLLFDHAESMYYSLVDAEGKVVAGSPGLPVRMLGAAGEHDFADTVLDGRRLRMVSLRRDAPKPFTIAIAQTTATRSELLHEMLLYSALPQAGLLALLAWWLGQRIKEDLDPLSQLEQAIDSRHGADLTPLPPEVRTRASTYDVERITLAIDSLFERLRASVAAQREFAGTVAHELRTPLAGIRAQAAFALDSESAEVWKQELAHIAQSEQRASRLVNQLLAVARAAEGTAGLRMERIDLTEVARDVLLQFVARARAESVDLGGEGLDEPVFVQGDRALIEGILNNLIDNALRYGRSDATHITVQVTRDENGAALSVTDNGPGLPAPDAEQLKNRWAQGDAGRRRGEGAGLGLAIVANYAELLGAALSFDAPPQGTGLCVRVRFRTPVQETAR